MAYTPSTDAERAASWVVNMGDGETRRALYNGHMLRRVETMKDGYRATDHCAADAWLVEQWRNAEGED